MDVVTEQKRREMMSRVRSHNTGPERIVRSVLTSMGKRYRLHGSTLPGKPDIFVQRYKKAIFVHGCFWHQHSGCRAAKRPTTNVDFWNRKLDSNIARDERNYQTLLERGWKCLVIWECQLKDEERLRKTLDEFFKS